MQEKYGFNNSNARNIFTLLKNAGFVDYEKGQMINNNDFFTNTGLAYVKILESLELLDEENESQKIAKEKFLNIKQKLIANGIRNIIKSTDCTFSAILKQTIEFLLKYNSIDKNEYGLLIFAISKDSENYIRNMTENITKYRQNKITINISVNTRDDESGMFGARKIQDASALTSYSYIIAILCQAGFVYEDKKRKRYSLNNKVITNIENIVEGEE